MDKLCLHKIGPDNRTATAESVQSVIVEVKEIIVIKIRVFQFIKGP